MDSLDLGDGRTLSYDLVDSPSRRRRHSVPWAFVFTPGDGGGGRTERIPEQDALALLRQHGVID